MKMLKHFIEESEKAGGTCNIRPHSALDSEIYFVEKILFTNFINSQKPKYLVMSLPSNMTVWELLDLIGQQINCSPLKILMRRGDKKPDIEKSDFGKSLRDLRFEAKEEISIIRSTNYGKVPLLNPQC